MRYILKDIELYGYHGVYEEEKLNGQYYSISISYKHSSISQNKDIELNSDDINNYINYMDVFLLVEKVFNNKRYNLIETLASEIHTVLLGAYDLKDLEIKITKKLSNKSSKLNEVIFIFKK